jgi:hypothetical protein
MAIFQVADITAARSRIGGLGVRSVWDVDLDDMASSHLHPKDTPGAIVSLDWADPAGSWRWAGPSWAGAVPDHEPGGITGLTVEVEDPAEAARVWGGLLGKVARSDGENTEVELSEAGQSIRFEPKSGDRIPGITEIRVRSSVAGAFDVGGVRFVSEVVSSS